MDIIQKITEELQVKKWQVEAAVTLIDEGNTIPFISRYRKEATGALNDEQLRKLGERLTYLRNLEDRKTTVLSAIEEQGKLTDELKARIEAAETMVVVEVLYRPYKQKKRTRATMAKERGLEGLASIIMLQLTKNPIEQEASGYVNPEKEVPKPIRKGIIPRDIRLFINTIDHAVSTMLTAGIEARSSKKETEDYIECIVRIPKKPGNFTGP